MSVAWIAPKDALQLLGVVACIVILSGIVSVFVFTQQDFKLEGGAKVILDNFTGLVVVVMAAYFGEAAVEAAAAAYRDAKVAEAKAQAQPGP